MRRRKKNPVKLLSLLLVQGMVLLGIGYVIFFSACEFDEYGEFRDDEFATLDEDGFQDYSLNVSTAARPACSSKKMQEILAPAKKAGHAAVVDCNLNLKKNNVITKRLIFQGKNATGVTMNCNNALLNGGYGTHNKGKDMIEVRSIRRNRNGVNTWERPERVTIKNCRVNGSIRIWGMATNGEGAYLRESSRRPGHIARARNNAPRIIVLSNLTISGVGRIPLYISPGVTHARVINSTFTGKSDSVTIYLDAESAANTIKNNKFHTQRTSKSKREVMAIDGSSHNTIMNNWFSGLNYGGIYLYRNCGEGGTVRHATPSYNKIINNIFYYNKYNKISAFPSIFLGSRQASSWYCNDDKGYRFGSSASNFDFATYNVVARNRFYKFTPQQAIRHGYPNVDIPNYFYQNARSDGAQPRPSMCYATNHNKNYINHGESTDKYYRNRGSCKTYTYTCNDGYLKRVSKKNGCAGRKMRFDCKVSGSNGGCSKTVSCPAGKRVINVAAACNLEYGDANAYNVPIDRLRVTRTSDYVQQGYCYVNSTRIQRKEARISIPKMRRGKYSSRRNSITVGCREHDKNGGDCHITGYLYCK